MIFPAGITKYLSDFLLSFARVQIFPQDSPFNLVIIISDKVDRLQNRTVLFQLGFEYSRLQHFLRHPLALWGRVPLERPQVVQPLG
jgi:hypothetical protein